MNACLDADSSYVAGEERRLRCRSGTTARLFPSSSSTLPSAAERSWEPGEPTDFTSSGRVSPFFVLRDAVVERVCLVCVLGR